MEKVIESFLNFLSVERGFSPNTISAYRNDLSQLATFVAEQASRNGFQPHWSLLDRKLMLDYILAIKERGYARTTEGRKLAAIKSFSKFLVAKGVLEQNPTADIAGPKVAKSLPKTISKAEVEELLRQPAQNPTPAGQRDKAMLALLYATGMRVSELASLNLDDIDLKAGTVTCGKGGKQRLIPITGAITAALQDYIESARPHLLGEHQEDALFLSRRGQRLTRQGFWLNLKNYSQKAGVEVTPHTLRHSIAAHLLHSGKVNLRELQELLGHANIATTQIYSHIPSQGASTGLSHG
jgi:integrase/recombinase XerD